MTNKEFEAELEELDIIAEAANIEDGMFAYAFRGHEGYHVCIRDLDAGMNVGFCKIVSFDKDLAYIESLVHRYAGL